MRLRLALISSVFFVLISVALPSAALAQATLFIAPASGAYKTGELFSVLINVNTGGQPINAASGQLNFDNQRLEISEIGFSRSVFSIWTEEPNYSNAGGVVRFSGGLPTPGFTGASGSILRITFKAKAAGSAPVVFVSGAVLANDGKGTNILDSLKGGLFTILSAVSSPAPATAPSPASKQIFEMSEKPISQPLITDWPKELEAGQTLTIKGLGFPNGKILISVQDGTKDPIIDERFAGSDGRFSYTYGKVVEAGLYRVWAKNVSPEGLISASSDIITIEVTAPLFFRIGTIALNYVSIIVTLLALILLLILLILFIWWKIRQWQKRQGAELSEAEHALHKGFGDLQSGLRKYLRYIAGTKSAEGVRRREVKTEEELSGQLKDIESGIEKEIEDITSKKKKE